MQDQKTAGQAEDWELSEAYIKKIQGRKNCVWRIFWRRRRQRARVVWRMEAASRSSWKQWLRR